MISVFSFLVLPICFTTKCDNVVFVSLSLALMMATYYWNRNEAKYNPRL